MNSESFNNSVQILTNSVKLYGRLILPKNSNSLVIFSHGTGSSSLSPRNKFIARKLNSANIGTLLCELLTPEEDIIFKNRLDIELLTERLVNVTNWISELSFTKNLCIGYFGVSIGAAACLKASTILSKQIKTIICKSGRTDLAEEYLDEVKCPTLLIAGSLDHTIIELNKNAYSILNCEKDFKIIDNASHFFEEENKIEEVALHSLNWYNKYLKLVDESVLSF